MFIILGAVFVLLILLLSVFLWNISGAADGKTIFNKNYYEEFSSKNIYTRRKKIEEFFTSQELKKVCKYISIPVKTLYTLQDIEKRLPYKSTWFLSARREHIGQLKLFITELQFLTSVLNSTTDEATIIYCGSAPSNKLAFFENLFPNIRWILIDPNEHKLMYPNSKTQYDEPFCKNVVYGKAKTGDEFVIPLQNLIKNEKSKISKSDFDNDWFDELQNAPDKLSDFWLSATQKYLIIEDFMTDDLACLLKSIVDALDEKNIPCFFISDIRTSSEFGTPTDLDILWNSAQQATWCRILRPKKAMLKFRTPFWETANSVKFESSKPFYANTLDKCKDFIDFVDDYNNGKYQYFTNDSINIQAFAGVESVETRLITSDYDSKTHYDFHNFEEKLFYYNRVYCDLLLHDEHQDCWDKEVGIDGCGDCAIMCGVFKAYFNKYSLPDTTLESIKALMNQITRGFKEKHSYHGIFYKPHDDLDQVIKLQIDVDSLMFYRSLRNKIKHTPSTFVMQKNRLELYGKFMELLDESDLTDLIKHRTKTCAVYIIETMPFFNANTFTEVAFSICTQNIQSLKVIKGFHKIIKSLTHKSINGKVEIEKWYEPMIKIKGFKNVKFNVANMKEFLITSKLNNVYELCNYKFSSFFNTTDIKHLLGVYYPELDGDFCIFQDLKLDNNSFLLVNLFYITEIFTYHILNNIQNQILKPCKNLKILILVDDDKNIFDYISQFRIYKSSEDKISEIVNQSKTIKNIVFYTYNISEKEVKKLLSDI